ncbi:hypothetical protein BJ170DRAFT_247941 [Xylariales sp. AK1849]|nr:hypothetical protein BJ170DRAFT_247941 [Xylariales sp. AK1849]
MAATTSHKIPFLYRFVFLYFEPAGALLGSALLHFHPQPFLSAVSPTAAYTASNQVVYDMLAATYVLFAFNEAVLLRLTDDILVWRTILLGILLCDAIHLYGSWSALGTEVFWNPLMWRWEDITNLGSLWGQGAIRVAFLCGIGLKTTEAKGKQH